MSRSPVQPDPEVARAVGATLFGGMLMAHTLVLPDGFALQDYLGVVIILSCLIDWSGALWLLVEGRDRVWWYALGDGTLTVLVWFLTQLFGLPVTERPLEGGWLDRDGLLLLFFAVNLVALSCWVLWARRRVSYLPVISARDRARKR